MFAFLKRRPVTLFYGLSLAIACGVVANGFLVMSRDADAAAAFAWLGGDIGNAGGYINIVWIWRFAMETPVLFGIFVFAAAPSIAAIATAAVTGRLPRLLAMLRPWNGPNPGRAAATYGVILFIYGAGLGAMAWITAHHSGEAALAKALGALGGAGVALVPAAVAALFLDEGGTLEELGWRGFLQDVLNERMAPLATAMTVGVLWWAWHLPREAGTILSGAPMQQFLAGQGVFLLLCLALSVLCAAAWNFVGGSVWVGVLIHGGTNVWSKALGLAPYQAITEPLGRIHPVLAFFDVRTILVLILAAAVLALLGPRLGRAPAAL